MNILVACLALFAVPVAAAPPVPAQSKDPPPAQVLAKVQKFYDSTKDLHARFDQVLESSMGTAKKASGDMWLKKPGKMRWDYVKPEKKLMVADGQTLWLYEPEDEQAFKQDLRSSTLPAQVSFLVGEGKLADEFDATVVHPKELEEPGTVVLKLVPRTASAAYRYLLFVVDGKTGQVLRTVIYDQQGGTNRLTFSGVELNRGVDDAKFKFTPPAGTKILPGSR
jgi:outer membrane lipoprotein carrier protein